MTIIRMRNRIVDFTENENLESIDFVRVNLIDF